MAEDAAESWREKGDALFKAGKYEEALDYYLNATDINPDLASAWHNMGLICLEIGQNDEADICFQKEWEIIQRASRERSRGRATREQERGSGTVRSLENTTPDMQREEIPVPALHPPQIQDKVPLITPGPTGGVPEEFPVSATEPPGMQGGIPAYKPGVQEEQETVQEEQETIAGSPRPWDRMQEEFPDITPELQNALDEFNAITPIEPKERQDAPAITPEPAEVQKAVSTISPGPLRDQDTVPGIPVRQDRRGADFPDITPELQNAINEFPAIAPVQPNAREDVSPLTPVTGRDPGREEVSGPSPGQPVRETPDELYEKALQLSRNNQQKEALLIFDRVLLLDPSNYKAWNSRGIAFARIQHYPEAKDSFSRSLSVNPVYKEAINNLARVNSLLGTPAQKKLEQPGRGLTVPGGTESEPDVLTQFVTCPHCRMEVPDDRDGTCPSCGRSLREQEKSSGHRSPVLAALLSFFIPGLGQVYTGNTFRGILLLVGAFVGFILLLVPGLIVLVYAVYDAYRTAKKINSGQLQPQNINIPVMVLFVIAAALMGFIMVTLFIAFMSGRAGV